MKHFIIILLLLSQLILIKNKKNRFLTSPHQSYIKSTNTNFLLITILSKMYKFFLNLIYIKHFMEPTITSILQILFSSPL